MKTKKFFGSVLMVISTAIIITACYKSKNAYNSSSGNYTISMKNSAFTPATLTVVAGSNVTWMNDDNMIHTVTTTEGSLNSGDIAVGASYAKTFSSTGTFNYYDAHNTNMTGVLIVTAASSGGGGGY
jgi:plastocyanin